MSVEKKYQAGTRFLSTKEIKLGMEIIRGGEERDTDRNALCTKYIIYRSRYQSDIWEGTKDR